MFSVIVHRDAPGKCGVESCVVTYCRVKRVRSVRRIIRTIRIAKVISVSVYACECGESSDKQLALLDLFR
jgi:hypothetical protein